MSKKKRLLCLGLGLAMGLSCGLCACDPKTPDEGTKPPELIKPGEDEKPGKPEEFKVEYRKDFTPTLFDGTTVKTEITELGEGAWLVANKIKLNDANDPKGAGLMTNRWATVYTVEVDLTRASIAAGTKDNKSSDFKFDKAVPYAHAQSWEKANEGGHVYASLNADFFGAQCVNAFVKDGVIVKDGHNDKGKYDYKDLDADLPASAPMLFGINGEKAQIAPIISYTGNIETAEVKAPLIQAKLGYSSAFAAEGGELREVDDNNSENSFTLPSFYYVPGTYSYRRGSRVIKLDLSKTDMNAAGEFQVPLLSNTVQTGSGEITVAEGEAYLVVRNSSSAFEEFDVETLTMTRTVHSPDGAWDGYNTILGCRQALVIKGEIPATVAKENSNGAQTRDIPRSAVGVKEGRVVLFAVEALRYYATRVKGETDPETGLMKMTLDDYVITKDDSFGMNLPELAEFMKFYGVSDGANFDGGGSTQLVTRKADEEAGKVVIRPADINNNDRLNPLKTRVVMNSILVTNKVK